MSMVSSLSVFVVFSLKRCHLIGIEMNTNWNYMEILLKKGGFLSDRVLDHSLLSIYTRKFIYLLHMVIF